jgi:hypothetical protein
MRAIRSRGVPAHGKRFRHRIESAGTQRLAACNSPQSEKSAAPSAKTRDSDARIVRATRVKTAARAE